MGELVKLVRFLVSAKSPTGEYTSAVVHAESIAEALMMIRLPFDRIVPGVYEIKVEKNP